jgi:hypothetical protein
MSIKEKAQGTVGGTVGRRLGGERPSRLQAAASAVVAGGLTSVVVFRLLRAGGDD